MTRHPPRGLTGKIVLPFLMIAVVWANGLSSGAEPPATSEATDASRKINVIDAQELKDWLERGRSFLLLDARSPEEFASGHIPTAVSMHRSKASKTHGKNGDRQIPTVFYCNGHAGGKNDPCFRAIVRELQNGSHQVYWFQGGIRAWQAQGYPVMRSSK